MPTVLFERLPLPSLKVYTSVSVLLLSCSIYYASEMTLEPEWELFKKAKLVDIQLYQSNATFINKLDLFMINNVALKRFNNIVYFMFQEPLCVWTLINMAYCCLILLGKVIQKLVFGELRVAEKQHIKDKFWNYMFYKFIFIFGVMNVQCMEEVVLWCSWFTILGFLHLLVQLCRDRYEYLSFSPTTPTFTHVKLFALLFGILAIVSCLFVVCVFVGFQAGLSSFCFTVAECFLVCLRTFHVIARYFIHLWDIKHEGVWERRTSYVYFCDLIFDLAGLAIDFLHHLHMLLWGNILLSMASLVIGMQLRFLFNEIQRRIKRHKNYVQVAKYMESNFPLATLEEIESNRDDCAICWDRMDSARKLQCGHLFHTSCLRSWLEQVSTCPTCRMSLVSRDNDSSGTNDQENHNNRRDNGLPLPQNRTTNHFFHFDGSRYVSWFPSFSVEVSHTSLMGMRHQPAAQTSQLESMAYQVQQLFPHMPMNLIVDNLRVTRSVELTIDNILDGELVAPPTAVFQGGYSLREQRPSTSSISTVEQEAVVSSSASSSSPSLRINSADNQQESPSPSTSGIGSSQNNVVVSESFSKASGDGCRFSKSSVEREQMLSRRREDLLNRARSKYMNKMIHPVEAFRRADSSL